MRSVAPKGAHCLRLAVVVIAVTLLVGCQAGCSTPPSPDSSLRVVSGRAEPSGPDTLCLAQDNQSAECYRVAGFGRHGFALPQGERVTLVVQSLPLDLAGTERVPTTLTVVAVLSPAGPAIDDTGR